MAIEDDDRKKQGEVGIFIMIYLLAGPQEAGRYAALLEAQPGRLRLFSMFRRPDPVSKQISVADLRTLVLFWHNHASLTSACHVYCREKKYLEFYHECNVCGIESANRKYLIDIRLDSALFSLRS